MGALPCETAPLPAAVLQLQLHGVEGLAAVQAAGTLQHTLAACDT